MNDDFTRMARAAFHLVLRGSTAQTVAATPKRVLLLNPAHIGDIVISTSLMGVLQSAFPGVEIGFATAGWSQCVVSKHPSVSYSHRIDHWRMNREDVSLPQKLRRYLKTRKQALTEIRDVKYDVALHLNAGSIDLLDVSRNAAIPVRVAFTKSMWAPYATLLAEYPENLPFLHQGDCQAELLRKLGIEERHFQQRRSTLAPSNDYAKSEVRRLLGGRDQSYSIIHMGAGAPFKELPPAFWHDIAAELSRERIVLFTGKGARERQNIERAIHGLDHCVNACDQLSWEGFVAAIRYAHELYGVDSVAGHVAAAVGTKSSNVYCGSASVPRWRPESVQSTVWTNAVPCSPCNRKRGCAHMTCLQNIEPLQILQTPLSMKTAK